MGGGFWLANIGFGNVVAAHRVVAVVSPAGAPMKRLRDEARAAGRLVDATEGRRTRSIIITDSGHVVLSALQTETVTQRLMEDRSTGTGHSSGDSGEKS
jgi:regulator of extracellular matrix RemA (YlzA/DUF370 family)